MYFQMKQIQRVVAFICVLLAAISVLSSCASKAESNDVTIWSSAEDYKNEFYLSELRKKFPNYNISLEYMNTSTIPAKVREEGEDCSCDIILSEEYNYLYSIEEYLAELDLFDYSIFLEEVVPNSNKFAPESKQGGGIIINHQVLEERGIPVPDSYADLLDPQYEGLISMPNPKSSGTAYMFLRQLTNEWGEDEAFEYFGMLSNNVLQYTSSGSGPVNALMQGEAAIGLGMTAQAVTEINNGAKLEVIFFEEGSPYNLYGNAVLKKSADRECVMDVFNYVSTDLCVKDNELFFPDQIFKEFVPAIEGFPTDIQPGDMSNNTFEEKERLLEKWTFS